MSTLMFRRYHPCDAHAVSQLFRQVYGDHYVQPDVYLPEMISQHNADGHWRSMVAVDGERVLGHAALCHDTRSDCAELALSVVTPAMQGRSIATRLGRELLLLSQALGLANVLIKQVTHHPYTQRMAANIGFHSTGVLPDYVPSPFAEPIAETIVTGCYVVQGHTRPLPDIAWPESCRPFMQHLCSVFGTYSDRSSPTSMPLQIRQHHQRYAIVAHRLNKRLLDQIGQLPAHWLVTLHIDLSRHFADDLHQLTAMGFTFTGLIPTQHSHGWFALFHRGVQPRSLSLHCPYMQQLHDDLQRDVETCGSARSAA
ncbi:GNAT family N-acetyltransferase [Pseudomonas sp. NPDC086278]|uniref:GNAT family N-acetyltransferase n=1 Tax=Pseudomonas sp. NPDC086278 TaxID=3390646 RepID=UPI003D0787C3